MSEIGEMVDDFICCMSERRHIISDRSYTQLCGKYACDDCLNNCSNEIYCYSCKTNHTRLPNIPISSYVLKLLTSNRDKMNNLLDNKLKYEELLHERLNVDYFTSEFNNKIEFIKEEIDLRIDSIVTQLNQLKLNLFRQLEKTKEFVFNGIITNENIEKIRNKYKDLSINVYCDYEAKLKELENDIKDLKGRFPIIEYSSNDDDIQMDIIGDLRVVKEILDTSNYNGDLTIPLSNNRLANVQLETIIIHDYESGKLMGNLKGHDDEIFSSTELPNNRLASGSTDSTIKIWDLSSYICIITLIGHEDVVRYLLTLPKSRLASSSDDGTIKIWNTDNYECIATLYCPDGSINCLEYLSGNRLASGSFDGVIKIWNLEGYILITSLNGHEKSVRCLKSISENVIVSGDYVNIVKLWNINDYNCIYTLNTGHGTSISSLILIPYGKLLTAGYDGFIKVWNMNDYTLITEIVAHNRAIINLIYLKNENRLVSVSLNEYKLWSMDNYSLVKTIRLLNSLFR